MRCRGDGFTLHCITDATGSTPIFPVESPCLRPSLDEDNTIRPYAIVSLTAAKPGYRTVRIQGHPDLCRAGDAGPAGDDPRHRGRPGHPERAHRHPAASFVCGERRQRPAAGANCTPRVLDRVIIPKNITVHLGKPAASARNVTVSFRDYIANVASSEVYPPGRSRHCGPTSTARSRWR